MKTSNNPVSANGAELQTLTLDETDQVGGGCVPVAVVVIAIACALLLDHD